MHNLIDQICVLEGPAFRQDAPSCQSHELVVDGTQLSVVARLPSFHLRLLEFHPLLPVFHLLQSVFHPLLPAFHPLLLVFHPLH